MYFRADSCCRLSSAISASSLIMFNGARLDGCYFAGPTKESWRSGAAALDIEAVRDLVHAHAHIAVHETPSVLFGQMRHARLAAGRALQIPCVAVPGSHRVDSGTCYFGATFQQCSHFGTGAKPWRARRDSNSRPSDSKSDA